jgi:hypothetical protein
MMMLATRASVLPPKTVQGLGRHTELRSLVCCFRLRRRRRIGAPGLRSLYRIVGRDRIVRANPLVPARSFVVCG